MASAFPLNLEQIREPSQAISWRTNPVYFCYISTQYVTTGMEPGGRLNKKDGLTRYDDSHVKDKTS